MSHSGSSNGASSLELVANPTMAIFLRGVMPSGMNDSISPSAASLMWLTPLAGWFQSTPLWSVVAAVLWLLMRSAAFLCTPPAVEPGLASGRGRDLLVDRWPSLHRHGERAARRRPASPQSIY